jgi:hypothetical protein
LARLSFTNQNQNAKDNLLKTIKSKGKEGIYKKNLIEEIGLNQSTVYRIAEKLNGDGLIRIEKNGQRTKYIAMNNQVKNVTLGGYLFGQDFADSYSFGHEGFVLPYGLASPNFTANSHLERTILEYANQIGGFFTYSFIQALNAENLIDKLYLLQKNSNKSIKSKEKQGKDIIKDWNQIRFAVEEWIMNSMGQKSTIIKMLWKFIQIIQPYGYVPDTATDEGLEKRKELGMYFVEKKHINELRKAFSNVYPKLYYELEKLCNALPEDVIQYQEEYIPGKNEKFEKQSKCKHEFSRYKPFSERDDHKRQIRRKHCIKCNYLHPKYKEIFVLQKEK